MTIPFRKMHGLGNDFIVFDGRLRTPDLSGANVQKLTDRHKGIGADTVVVIDNDPDQSADIFVRFFNSDGMQIGTCGNATRCVAKLFFEETGRQEVRIRTIDGVLSAWRAGNDIAVDMGQPGLEWSDVHLAQPTDTLHVALDGAFSDAVTVSMGNPHAVFFTEDAEEVDLAVAGKAIEYNQLFLRRINVEFATVQAPDRIRMRVWERGVGITQACGSGACATLVAAARRNLTERKATLVLDGGELTIEWRDDDHVIMTGAAVLAFTGEVDLPSSPRAAAA